MRPRHQLQHNNEMDCT